MNKNVKKWIICAGCLLVFILAGVIAAMCCQSKEIAEEQRQAVAKAFVEMFYTGDAKRYEDHLRASETKTPWESYYVDYEALATESCLSAMEHYQFVMVDAFEAESGAEVLVDGVRIEPMSDNRDEGELWKYFYSVDFRVALQDSNDQESYRAEGVLHILHLRGGEPKVHFSEMSDTNLFEYILQRVKRNGSL